MDLGRFFVLQPRFTWGKVFFGKFPVWRCGCFLAWNLDVAKRNVGKTWVRLDLEFFANISPIKPTKHFTNKVLPTFLCWIEVGKPENPTKSVIKKKSIHFLPGPKKLRVPRKTGVVVWGGGNTNRFLRPSQGHRRPSQSVQHPDGSRAQVFQLARLVGNEGIFIPNIPIVKVDSLIPY